MANTHGPEIGQARRFYGADLVDVPGGIGIVRETRRDGPIGNCKNAISDQKKQAMDLTQPAFYGLFFFPDNSCDGRGMKQREG
jgi:hypothetical protein